MDHLKGVARSLSPLAEYPNCLPFTVFEETNEAGYMTRQYVYKDLNDRLSTRPFLDASEKRWIAYQLLAAVDQMYDLPTAACDVRHAKCDMRSAMCDVRSVCVWLLLSCHPAGLVYVMFYVIKQ